MSLDFLTQTANDYDMDIDDVIRIHDKFDNVNFYEKLEEFINERKLRGE